VDDPSIRFGIKHPDSQSLKVLSCSLSVYHALKGDIRSGKVDVQLHSSVMLNVSWSVFANVITAEAMEMQLVTRTTRSSDLQLSTLTVSPSMCSAAHFLLTRP